VDNQINPVISFSPVSSYSVPAATQTGSAESSFSGALSTGVEQHAGVNFYPSAWQGATSATSAGLGGSTFPATAYSEQGNTGVTAIVAVPAQNSYGIPGLQEN
jgi:L-cysteine desulfidase